MAVSTGGTENMGRKKSKPEDKHSKLNGRLAKLSIAALGVVFRDIRTSPIYPIRECFHGE